ncbi:hypothetical protein BG004_006294 [Podila humilis]|nr:hypothetical protein BG004_006294 [Podila humilis]
MDKKTLLTNDNTWDHSIERDTFGNQHPYAHINSSLSAPSAPYNPNHNLEQTKTTHPRHNINNNHTKKLHQPFRILLKPHMILMGRTIFEDTNLLHNKIQSMQEHTPMISDN